MKKPFNHRLDETLINNMKKVAKKENRTVTNLIETVMGKYCKHSLGLKQQHKIVVESIGDPAGISKFEEMIKLNKEEYSQLKTKKRTT